MSRNRCIASTEQIRRAVYLLIYIKPLDAFTSGAERLQSELVQTFPKLELEKQEWQPNYRKATQGAATTLESPTTGTSPLHRAQSPPRARMEISPPKSCGPGSMWARTASMRPACLIRRLA